MYISGNDFHSQNNTMVPHRRCGLHNPASFWKDYPTFLDGVGGPLLLPY